jgi:hypothetical protein
MLALIKRYTVENYLHNFSNTMRENFSNFEHKFSVVVGKSVKNFDVSLNFTGSPTKTLQNLTSVALAHWGVHSGLNREQNVQKILK